MESKSKTSFTFIINDNEQAAALALDNKNFVQAFILVHVLIEALLRKFLKIQNENIAFNTLVQKYKSFLEGQQYSEPTFVEELMKFNQRRNRIIHQLWKKGFSFTNRQTEQAAQAAVKMYGLFIEWLETFDPEITQIGFKYY